jgi:hypothetical protein
MSFWRVISEAQSLRTEFLRTKDCQSSRKSYKTYVFVGWVVGWKKPQRWDQHVGPVEIAARIRFSKHLPTYRD